MMLPTTVHIEPIFYINISKLEPTDKNRMTGAIFTVSDNGLSALTLFSDILILFICRKDSSI